MSQQTSIDNPLALAAHSRIEVLELHPVNQGSIRAYVRIKVGAFAISGCKVIQQPGQRAWVKLPDQQSLDGRWFPIVTCSSPTLESAIGEVVLAAWAKEVKA